MPNNSFSWSFDTNLIELSKIPIPIPELPSEFDGYQITQLSDFHLGTWLDSRAIKEIVDLVNSLDSDLIAITGDFVSSRVDQHAPYLKRAIRGLLAKDGVVAVLGNHDHYTDAVKIKKVLLDSGVKMLDNKVWKIQRGKACLYIAGIDDQMTGHDNFREVISSLPKDGAPVILLAHAPDFAEISSRCGMINLQLSGHTHGGQIRLPVIGPLYLPRNGRKYPSGKYKVGKMHLYTNRGLGTSWLKIRYDCPPEIATFELRPG